MQDAGWISTGLDNYLELLMQRVASGRLIFRDGWVWTSRGEFVTDWYHVDEPSNRFNPKGGHLVPSARARLSCVNCGFENELATCVLA